MLKELISPVIQRQTLTTQTVGITVCHCTSECFLSLITDRWLGVSGPLDSWLKQIFTSSNNVAGIVFTLWLWVFVCVSSRQNVVPKTLVVGTTTEAILNTVWFSFNHSRPDIRKCNTVICHLNRMVHTSYPLISGTLVQTTPIFFQPSFWSQIHTCKVLQLYLVAMLSC